MATAALSDVEKQLQQTTGVKPKRNEERDVYLTRLLTAVDTLTDAAYEGLSDETKEWFDAAVAAKKADRALPPFPDEEDEDEEEEEDGDGEEETDQDDADIKVTKTAPTEADDDDDGEEDEEDGEEEETDEPAPTPAAKPSRAERRGKKGSAVNAKAEKKAAPAKAEKKAAPAKAEKKAEPKKVAQPRTPGGREDSVLRKLRVVIAKHPKWSKDQVKEELTKQSVKIGDSTLNNHFRSAHAMMAVLGSLGKLNVAA